MIIAARGSNFDGRVSTLLTIFSNTLKEREKVNDEMRRERNELERNMALGKHDIKEVRAIRKHVALNGVWWGT